MTNGNFNSGLIGWTAYTTPNGNIAELPSLPGTPAPQTASVVSFNVNGSDARNSLFLNVGAVNPPYGATEQGGCVFQTFTSLASIAAFSADIAAFSRTGNGSAGIFSVLLDGIVMDMFDFSDITAMTTERSTLDFSFNLSVGEHTLSLLATRPCGPGRSVGSQYFTNLTFDQTVVASVPEPASWALTIGGLAIVGASMRRRRAVVSFS